MNPGKDFDGAVVIVTGASTGLGRAIAVEVAERGAKAVVINYARSVDEAQETAGFVRQSRDFAKACGTAARYVELPDFDHYSIMSLLETPQAPLARLIDGSD